MSAQDFPSSEEIAIGQIWQENDPRVTRFVRVTGFQGPFGVVIRRCDAMGILVDGYRATVAVRRRFNGRRSGYKLVTL